MYKGKESGIVSFINEEIESSSDEDDGDSDRECFQ